MPSEEIFVSKLRCSRPGDNPKKGKKGNILCKKEGHLYPDWSKNLQLRLFCLLSA